MKRLIGALVASVLLTTAALAAQATHVMPTTGPMTFSTFVGTDLNPALAAMLGKNSGATAPAVTSQPATYQDWMDTSGSPTGNLWKIYDGASWVTTGTLNATAHTWTPTAAGYVVTGSTVPADGVYLPAANTVGIAANSAGEVQISTTAMSPVVSDGNALGTTALQWGDLFGASGFTLNIANGDWLATHSAGVLTVGTGDLRITTAGTNAASAVTTAGTQTLTNKTFDTAGTGNSFSIDGAAAQGDVTYFNGTKWTRLAAGTSGQVLKTNGAGANPSWLTVGGTGTVTSVATGTGLTGGPITTSGTVDFSVAAVGTWAATPSSANLAAALTNETGSGAAVFATSPTLVTPTLGAANATSINFGGTSLAAYTEGTWTPTVEFGGNSTGMTYSRRAGAYTKIGDIVCVMADITLSAKGSSTGTLTVTGLPVATGGVGTTFTLDLGSSTWTGFTAGMIGRASSGGTGVSFRAQTTSGQGTTTAVTDANATNTSVLNFSGCYLS